MTETPRRRITDHLPWRLVPILAYLVLAAAAAYSVGKVQSSVNKIEEVEARTFEAICQRQREGLTRLRETKMIVSRTNGTLVALLDSVEPAVASNAQRFEVAKAKLSDDVAKLERGIAELGRVIPPQCPTS